MLSPLHPAAVACIIESDKSSKEYRKNWAKLIKKIYEVDPLTWPKCRGTMRINSFIEDREVIKRGEVFIGEFRSHVLDILFYHIWPKQKRRWED